MKDLAAAQRNLCKGAIVYAKTDELCLLECSIGCVGLVVEEYSIGGSLGWTVIFENGENDGFSVSDASRMLFWGGAVSDQAAAIQFSGAIQLARAFDSGCFADAFANAKTYGQALAESEGAAIAQALRAGGAPKNSPRI